MAFHRDDIERVRHATNIVDGMNGLMGLTATAVLAAICVAMFDGLTLQESITKTKVNWRHVVATLRQTLIEGVVAAAKPPQEA